MDVPKEIALIGAPVDCGSRQAGCLMGPDALRTAGLCEAISSLGHRARDMGNIYPLVEIVAHHPNPAIYRLAECSAWIRALGEAAFKAVSSGLLPIFMGGDHLMSAGTVTGVARAAGRKPQFVLWLDAHSDFHTLETTRSGNLHGTPVAYFTGQDGFGGYFPPVQHPMKPGNISMLGIRSIDDPERERLCRAGAEVNHMRLIDEEGIVKPLNRFLDRIRAAEGRLHVSLDVDFLDPGIAPAVGTTVPGGTSFREAHLVMEILHDSGLVTSLDIAELNPFLDERGKTARLMVDLVASLFGKSVMDRPTGSL